MNLFKNFKFKPRFVYFRSKIHPNQRTFCSKFQQNVIEAKMRDSSWESVVGLEVHAQIQTKSKLFSRAGTTFSAPVNSQVSVFDASLPGTLPVLNKACVEAAILTALALHSKINKVSMFDRKHYFYADLPLGYQITQQRLPLAYGGFLDFVVWNSSCSSPYKMKSKIHQIQLEQDSGKSLHDEESNCSLIDLNRAGIPLMEIVFEADLKNGEEAAALIEELQLLLRYIGTCDGKMDEGSLRVDANVSVNRPGNALGTRTEIKNLNSIRTLSRAIDFEIGRQIDVLEAGGVINNETRTFDTKSRETVPMRDKEMQQDYRFMPEPNLPPLRLQDELDEDLGLISINQLKLKLPKLPEQIREHITTKYELPVEIANILLREEGLLNFFESMVSVQNCDFKAAANFILNDLFAALYEKEMKISSCPVSPEIVGMLLELKTKGVISEAIKDQVLRLLIDGDPRTPLQIIKDNKWEKITDTKEIEDICIAVLQENIHLVKKYKGGKIKIFNQLLGLVKKNSNTVDMKIANRILKEKIKMF